MQHRRARFDVALSLIELKRYDSAAKELAALHVQQPASAISNALGIVELRKAALPGAALKAVPFFERAAGEGPGETDYLFNLGYAYALAGDDAHALLSLRETVRYDAADGDAHLVMATMLGSDGRAAESQRELDLARLLGTALETALPRPPDRRSARAERAADRSGRRAPGGAAFASAANRRSKRPLSFTSSRAFADRRRDREAIANLQRSIYLAPYQDEPHPAAGTCDERAAG
jgi:predicted Zn-dependent protease